jgi:RNA-directed DNA polymerase
MQTKQAQAATAEVGEGRARAKGHTGPPHRGRTQGRAARSRALDRGRPAARESARRLTARWHPVDAIDRRREASDRRHHEAAPGVDGPTWAAYGAPRDPNLRDVSERLQRGAYPAPPVARVSMPQADGRQRPIGKPTREENLVQRATVEGLNTI